MRHVLWVVCVFSVMVAGPMTWAQEGTVASPSSGTFSLYSKPSGAFVYMEGDYDFVGRTPCEVPFRVEGTYQVKALKPGYENWSTRVMLAGDEPNSLYIRLIPKTKLKAAIRSAIFPGWGQYYSDRKTKGIIFGLLQIGSVIGTAYAYQNYEDAKEDYYQVVDRYRAEKQIDELSSLREEMNDKRREADKAWELRNTFLALTGGIWAYNVLESVLFFPRYEQDIYHGATPMISSSIDRDGAKIVIVKRF